MKAYLVILVFALVSCSTPNSQEDVHVWQKIEIELEASNEYDNPYTEVDVWVQLKGPDFNKRCYGFWDGNNTWRIRVMATGPGEWSWISGSNQEDDGLNGKRGSIQAIEWNEIEKTENPLRRGMIRSTSNGHAFEYADGTPLFWLADTWWPCMTKRYYWYEDDKIRKVGTPEAGFKDREQLVQGDAGSVQRDVDSISKIPCFEVLDDRSPRVGVLVEVALDHRHGTMQRVRLGLHGFSSSGAGDDRAPAPHAGLCMKGREGNTDRAGPEFGTESLHKPGPVGASPRSPL